MPKENIFSKAKNKIAELTRNKPSERESVESKMAKAKEEVQHKKDMANWNEYPVPPDTLPYERISHTFSNGITVINTTPYAISFQSPEGGTVEIPSSIEEGVKVWKPGFALLDTASREEGEEILKNVKNAFREADHNGTLMIVGSDAVRNMYQNVVGTHPAPGYENAPDNKKLMSCDAFEMTTEQKRELHEKEIVKRFAEIRDSGIGDIDDNEISPMRERLKERRERNAVKRQEGSAQPKDDILKDLTPEEMKLFRIKQGKSSFSQTAEKDNQMSAAQAKKMLFGDDSVHHNNTQKQGFTQK